MCLVCSRLVLVRRLLMEILLFSNIQMAQFRCVLLSISLKFFPWMFSLVLCACLLILFIARTNDESKSLIIGLGEFSSIHFVYDVVGWMSKPYFWIIAKEEEIVCSVCVHMCCLQWIISLSALVIYLLGKGNFSFTSMAQF